MTSPFEVADVFRRHAEDYRREHAGRLGRGESRVISAIASCRTAALGGHVEGCDDCGALRIAYNSCRNRHCPKCRGQAREAWLAARQSEVLPVRALSRLFRRLFLAGLKTIFRDGGLGFFGDLAGLAEPSAFADRIAALQRGEWVVYAKPPFGGPAQVLAFLARYTHRAAIANSRLVAVSEDEVDFAYKDYRRGGQRKVMRLHPREFIRRFLLHVLPDGFHRIRHYGFMAKANRREKLQRCRALLATQTPCDNPPQTAEPASPTMLADRSFFRCPDCGGVMRRLATLPPIRPPPFLCDTS